MAAVNIKIVGTEGKSVLVKYASDNSKKSIDEYDPIAFQPTAMGYNTPEEFLEAIKPYITAECIKRDGLENANTSNVNISAWVNTSTSNSLTAPPTEHQVVTTNSEVIL